MGSDVRRTLVVLWTYAVSWFFSALLHVVDSDIGHIGGLRKPSVIFSVSIVALLFTAPGWLAYVAYRRSGWKAFSVVVAGLAVGKSLLVAVLGAGRSGAAPAAVGLAVLFGLAITIAALGPIWAFGRVGKGESSHS